MPNLSDAALSRRIAATRTLRALTTGHTAGHVSTVQMRDGIAAAADVLGEQLAQDLVVNQLAGDTRPKDEPQARDCQTMRPNRRRG